MMRAQRVRLAPQVPAWRREQAAPAFGLRGPLAGAGWAAGTRHAEAFSASPTAPPPERDGVGAAVRGSVVPLSASDQQPMTSGHPLAERELSAGLQAQARVIDTAFAAIEPLLKSLAKDQFSANFVPHAQAILHEELGLDVAPEWLRTSWSEPLAMPALRAHCVLGTFCRLVEDGLERGFALTSEGENAADLIRRFGFHAIDITPCADGRLCGVVDHILRVPPAIVAYRRSFAGALFDVEEALRHWEHTELSRWRAGVPNAPLVPSSYLKMGVYHFSRSDPAHGGCAAHGSDERRAAEALLRRLDDFAAAVRHTHGADVPLATLLVGVDTDSDAVRVHVPDATGQCSVERSVDALDLYGKTQGLSRDAAKELLRAAVARCAGVPADDPGTEGMRWLCGYLLKNNLAQVDAVRVWHGGSYAERGHTERLIVVGDSADDVQLRNLAFQAQMDTLEEGAADLDVGVKILGRLLAPAGLAVPVLVHVRYEPKIPGAAVRARHRASRLSEAIARRYTSEVRARVHVEAVLRAGENAKLESLAPRDVHDTRPAP